MAKLFLLIFAAAVSASPKPSDAGSEAVAASASITKLKKDLFRGYDNQVIPVRTSGKPVELAFGLALIDMDTQNDGTVDLEMWVRAVWNDHRLQWHEKDYNGIDVLRVPPENVWLPDIKLYNQLGLAENGAPLKADGNRDTNVLVYPNGEVLFIPPATFKIHCFNESSFGVQKNWPWGEHKCHMKFGSWTYDGFHLSLSLYNNKKFLDMADFRAGPVRMVDNSMNWVEKFYPCCEEPYPSIMVNFTLQQLYRVEQDGSVTYNPFVEIADLQHGNYDIWRA